MGKNIMDDIRKLVAEIIEEDPEQIDAKSDFIKDLGMDSMMALEILAGIEKRYKIAIPEEMLPKFINLEETHRIVAEIIDNKK